MKSSKKFVTKWRGWIRGQGSGKGFLPEICLSLTVFQFLNCATHQIGNISYMEAEKKVQSPEKQKLIAEHCDNWGPPRLDKAFANAKIESLQNASIVLDVPCFKIYSDKEPQKSAE